MFYPTLKDAKNGLISLNFIQKLKKKYKICKTFRERVINGELVKENGYTIIINRKF